MVLARKGLSLALVTCMWLAAARTYAVTLTLDYRYDTFDFFAPGSQARTTLEAAAGFYSNVLNDSLSAIQPPVFDGLAGQVKWKWAMALNHPSAASQVILENETIDANEFLIFAGARTYSDSTLAAGSPGGLGYFNGNCCPRSGPTPSSFPTAQSNQIYAIDAAFTDAVTRRGESTGFASWGGAISFDQDTAWHYNHTTAPAAGKVDLYTVAIHELAHTLGFGTSTEWTSLVTNPPSGSVFNGNAAKAKYGGPVPIAGGGGHWQEGIGSTVFGGTQAQAVIMTPGITPGIRRRLTALDAAALTDLGWELIAPPALTGDYNNDGTVNAADYTVWRNSRGITGSGLAADGNHNNAIDIGDFTLWKTNFGQSGSAGGIGVPEIGSYAYLLTALLLTVPRRRRLIRSKA